MDKDEQLRKLHEKWFSECTCELKNTATQPVPGVGSAHAQVVFIGEAPGKDEDLKGEPFVGRAGKFLNEMLEAIHLKRSDVYITNIVKYRPPNNRDPEPDEKDACFPWLLEELSLIHPALICFLGRHSMNHFFPDEKIGNVHGKILKKKFNAIPTTHFFPLYHPASALYNGSMRDVLLEDFKMIPRVLEKVAKESGVVS